MGYLFAILGSIAAFFAIIATLAAFGKGTDIQLILGGVYWISAMIGWVGAGIIFRMDDGRTAPEKLLTNSTFTNDRTAWTADPTEKDLPQ